MMMILLFALSVVATGVISRSAMLEVLRQDVIRTARAAIVGINPVMDIQAGFGAVVLRALHGRKVAYIFEGPLSMLHPRYRIGDQLTEAIRVHDPVSHKEAH